MSKTASRDHAPLPLRQQNLTARILYREVWRAANVEDDWFCFAVVGREGSGKSETCASILSACDPTFSTKNAHFKPHDFIDDLENKAGEAGHAVMGDEVGVWLGNRTWHDFGQIKLNKALQTARDDNCIVGLTLPRLEELDVQTEGRLHALLEMQKLKKGQYSTFKFKHFNPTRDGRNEMYKHFPREQVGGRTRRVTELKIGPPPEWFVETYKEKKDAFKQEFYDETREELTDDDGEVTPQDAAEEILNSDLDEYIKNNNGQRYLDKDLIGLDYGFGDPKAKKAKKAILREIDDDLM